MESEAIKLLALITLSAFFGAPAIAAWIFWRGRLKRARQGVADRATSRIRSAVQGPVEIFGALRTIPGTSKAIQGEDGIPIAVSRRLISKGEETSAIERFGDLLVDDGTGEARIHPDSVNFIMKTSATWTSPDIESPRPIRPTGQGVGSGAGRYKIVERYIIEGEQVQVRGELWTEHRSDGTQVHWLGHPEHSNPDLFTEITDRNESEHLAREKKIISALFIIAIILTAAFVIPFLVVLAAPLNAFRH